jgi:hypothetical protein
MGEPMNRPSEPHAGNRKFISGTRSLLALIVLVALGLGWFAHEIRKAERRTVLVGKLARSGAVSLLDEPTYVAQIVKKFWPGRETWIRGQIGSGWFDHPSIFVCSNLRDDQVSGIVQRLQELGTVQEVHYDGALLTEAGITRLQEGLPGVNVVPNSSPALHHYFLASMGAHAAYGVLGFMIVVALTLLCLLTFAIRWVVRRFLAAGPARPGMAEPLAG